MGSILGVGGNIVPIVLCEGKILDGWQRYRGCLEAGIEPVFGEYVGDMEPLDYFVTVNLVRQHRSPQEDSLTRAATFMARAEEARRSALAELGEARTLLRQVPDADGTADELAEAEELMRQVEHLEGALNGPPWSEMI